jgi:subfamily B ATP-binding cassette protein MsbA
MGAAMPLTSLAALLNLPVPLLVQELIDRVVTQGRWQALPLYAAGLMAVFAAQAGLSRANGLLVGGIGQGMVRNLRRQLYDRLQRLSLAYYDRTPSGAILLRLMDDVGAIQTVVTGQTFTILTDLGTMPAIAALLLARDWRLALVVFLVAPLFAFNFCFFMTRIRETSTVIRETSTVIREKMDQLFGHLKAKIDAQAVIKACAQEPAEVADFAARLQDVHAPRVWESQLGVAFANFRSGIGGVGTAFVFAVGAYEVLQGRLTAGQVV